MIYFRFIAGVVLLSTLTGCSDGNSESNTSSVLICGHGGSGFETIFYPTPANTFESITNAVIGENADGVEMDIQLTKDSVLIVYHDKDLDKKTDCTGKTYDLNMEDIAQCDFHGDFPLLDAGSHRILQLNIIMEYLRLKTQGKYFYLNVKPGSGPTRLAYNNCMARQLAAFLPTLLLDNYIIVETADMDLLMAIRALAPRVILMQDIGLFSMSLRNVVDHNLAGVVVEKDNITAEQVQQAHDMGLKVVIYGLKSRAGILKVLNMQPDAVQTDRIALTQRLRN